MEKSFSFQVLESEFEPAAMGAGGRMSVSTKKEEKVVTDRVPYLKPPFTLSQIKKAIPPHCFKRSVLRSFSYVVYDLIIASII